MSVKRPRFKGGGGPKDAPDIGIAPSSSEPSESSIKPEDVGEAPSGVGVATPIEEGGIGRVSAFSEPSDSTKPTWEGRDAQLDRQNRQEVISRQVQEVSIPKEKEIVQPLGSEMVTHLGVTMTREQFEADFPEDTVPYSPLPSHSGPSPMVEWLQNVEDAAVGFKTNMEMAGRELGAEALEAWKEGDYVEALFKGTAAFSARGGAGIYDATTFMVRPLAWVKTGEALFLGTKDVIEHPEDVPSGVQKWAKNIAQDPGSIVQFAGDIATGLAVGEVIKTLAGPTHVMTRLDDIDVDVKSTTLKMVDEVDPITGSKVKVPQFPEAELKSTISKRKVPKVVSEIMDAELDDIPSSSQILGVADEGGITVLDKIDLPEGTVDDLLSGKTVKIDDVIDVETLKIGSETFEYVDEIADPLTGTKTRISKTGKATPIDAKEIGVTMEVAEDASRLSKLTLETGDNILDDTIITRPPPEIDFDTVKFKSLWDEEGVKGILEEGKRSYDVKGMVTETKDIADDLVDDIKPIEPTSGPKTPFKEHFKQPGYTESQKDIAASLAKDVELVRDLTEGVKPVAKIITEAPKGSPTISAGIGVGTSLASDPLFKEITTPTKVKTIKKTGPPTLFGDMGKMPRSYKGPPESDGGRRTLPNPYFKDTKELEKEMAKTKKDEGEKERKGKSPLEGTRIDTKTLEDELKPFDDSKPIMDIDVKDDLGLIDDVKSVIDTDIDLLPKPTPIIIIKPKPKPTPIPEPPKISPKVIPDVTPLIDVIEEPDVISDLIVKTTVKQIQKQDQALLQALSLRPISRQTTRTKNILRPPRKLLYPRRKQDDDLFGFERKKYDILSPKQVRELGLKSSGKMPKDMLLKRKKGKLDLL